MTELNDSPALDEADFQLIVALAIGMNQIDAGKWVCTPDFPDGMSDRSVRNRESKKKASYDWLKVKIGSALQAKRAEFEELTKEKYREQFARLRAKGLAVKEKALDAALVSDEMLPLGVKVAESVEDRDFGKAKQVMESVGDVNHHLYVWTPQTPQQLLAQEHDMLDSDELLKALPGDVLEAELVADA
jgi:hypothetical protein